MLRRRAKTRYLTIMHGGQVVNAAVNSITRRCIELFGHVVAEKASIRLVRSDGATTIIIKCRLEQLDNVLAAIALTDPPVVTLDMSATIKRLDH
jgi:RNase P/RNase MRP subunit POP5